MKYYFGRRHKAKQRAHIWTGNDTVCRMWSTGGLGKDSGDLRDNPGDHQICTMCQRGHEQAQDLSAGDGGMRTLLENLREDQRAPVLDGVKWAGRFIVNDIAQAIDEIVALQERLKIRDETIVGLRGDLRDAANVPWQDATS